MFNKDDVTAFDYHNKAVLFLHDAQLAKKKLGMPMQKYIGKRRLNMNGLH
jgi:hypothetical protein